MSLHPIVSLCHLLSTYPPPFIFVHDPLHASPSPIDVISKFFAQSGSSKVISIDARECVSPKIFFDTVVDQLVDWTPTLDANGVARCWADTQSTAWDKTWETFVQALKDGFEAMTEGTGEIANAPANVTLVIQSTERLAKDNSNLMLPLIRIREIVSVPAKHIRTIGI